MRIEEQFSDYPDYSLLVIPRGNEFKAGLNLIALLKKGIPLDEASTRDARVAQEGFAIEGSTIFIDHIQGTGPVRDLRRDAIDPKLVFEDFKIQFGINPLAGLLCGSLLTARQHGIREAVWKPNPLKNDILLNRERILSVTGFLPDETGTYRCNLTDDEGEVIERILRRSNGSYNSKRRNDFWHFYKTAEKAFQTVM